MRHLLIWIITVILLLLFAPMRAFATEVDLRPVQMNQVLASYNSPMVGYEKELIQLADEHGLDWTLLAAIAGTESSFGKRMPANCLNPYGWGIYGEHKLCYQDFKAAAQAVAEGLSSKYNTTSLRSIGRTYNQVSTDSWIAHTQFFIDKIKSAPVPVQSLPLTL